MASFNMADPLLLRQVVRVDTHLPFLGHRLIAIIVVKRSGLLTGESSGWWAYNTDA
jgi:hypothetical protein